MALLDITQRAASRLGLRQPQSVVGSTDLTAQILLELANQEGEELAHWHDWQGLLVQKTFTTLAQVAQTDALPADDYDRLGYNTEIWNRTLNVRYVKANGPTWQAIQSGISAGTPGWWRIVNGQLNIFPAPTAGQTIAFEYISKNWCESAGGDAQDLFMEDTDVALLPERIVLLGIVWRFKAAREYAYAEDMATYERQKELAAANDRGTARISSSDGTELTQGHTVVVEVSA